MIRPGRIVCILHAFGVAAALLLTASCDDRRGKPPTPPAEPSAIAQKLGVDAAALEGEPVDPPAPAGDLKAEIDRFAGVEACVKERARVDPLLGDALSAIGYDTFVRDACRLLEAAHDKKRERCERIDSSALRARCEAWVAILEGAPDGCPLAVPGAPSRGRDAACLAAASRDPRMCDGAASPRERVRCQALVHRDPGKCPGSDRACAREAERWRSVLRAPLDGLPALPEIGGKLTVRGELGTPDPPATELDVSRELSSGVVLVTARERGRVELGAVDLAERTRFGGAPNRPARFGVVLVVEPEIDPRKQKLTLDRVELDVPGHATLATPDARCDCKVVSAEVGKARGARVAVVVEGAISAGPASYRFRYEGKTFVRDVLPDVASGPRIVPPSGLGLGLGIGAREGGAPPPIVPAGDASAP